MKNEKQEFVVLLVLALAGYGCTGAAQVGEADGGSSGSSGSTTGLTETGGAEGGGDPVGDGDGDLTGDGDGDPVGAECGNGMDDEGEECDPGGTPSPTGGCLPSCKTPQTCKEILEAFPGEDWESFAAAEFLIAPRDGVTTFPVLCDMTTEYEGETGGWTGIRLHNTCEPSHPEQDGMGDLHRTIVEIEEAALTVDTSCRPGTIEGEDGGHAYAMLIEFPPGFGEMFASEYKFGTTSPEMGNNESSIAWYFEQSKWGKSYIVTGDPGEGAGDISFGSNLDEGPVYSVARATPQLEDCNEGDNPLSLDWPTPFGVTPGSTTLRIQWGEYGDDVEGWYPWWSGVIYLR